MFAPRSLILSSLLLASACTKDAANPAPSQSPTPTPAVVDHVEAVTRTATLPIDDENGPDEGPVEAGKAPKGCPAWTAIHTCFDGENAFAVGEVKGIRDPGLASTTARNRAVAKLAGAEGSISGSAVVGQAHCAKRIFVAVRAPADAVNAKGVATCDPAALTGLR
ncbi:MAG: hypothetical protein U1E65_26170 [Myxococcota bacterium]